MNHAGSPKSFVGQRDCFSCGSSGFWGGGGSREGGEVAVDFFNIISDPMVTPR